MACLGTCYNILGQDVGCSGGEWDCGPAGSGCISNNCYWSGGGGNPMQCCVTYIPNPDGGNMCTAYTACNNSCQTGCVPCTEFGVYCPDGGDSLEDTEQIPCACMLVQDIEVTSNTGSDSDIGGCNNCLFDNQQTDCANMCNSHCSENYGTNYASPKQCIDVLGTYGDVGDIIGDSGTVYPTRSYSNCVGQTFCWQDYCNCQCNNATTITYTSVTGPFIGCTDPDACNYTPGSLCDDGTCEYDTCTGCTDPGATNYNPTSTQDDGSCEYYVAECTDPSADNCDLLCEQCEQGGTYDCETEGECEYLDENDKPIGGCTDPDALNYNYQAMYDDGSCLYNGEDYMCEGEVSCEDFFNTFFTCPQEYGCEPDYNPPPPDSGSCQCGNYHQASVCSPGVSGGFNNCNFEMGFQPQCLTSYPNCGACECVQDPNFTPPPPDGETIYACSGHMSCFDILVNTGECIDEEPYNCEPYIPPEGCTDNEAWNYQPSAVIDDGSCFYYPSYEVLHEYYETFTCTIWSDGSNYFCQVLGHNPPSQNWNIILYDAADYGIDLNTIGELVMITFQIPFLGEHVLGYDYDTYGGIWYVRDESDFSEIEILEEDDIEDIFGCTNEFAYNYNLNATFDDGSCLFNLTDGGANQQIDLSIMVDNIYGQNFRVDKLTLTNTPEFQDYSGDDLNTNFGMNHRYVPQLQNKIINERVNSRSGILQKKIFHDRFNKLNGNLNQLLEFNRANRIEDIDEETNTRQTPCVGLGFTPSPIRISEVMYSPRQYQHEWIEIYNDSGNTIDISGFKFVRGIYFTFPQGTFMAPYSYTVIARPQQDFCSPEYPFTCPVFCLNANGDPVTENGETGTCHYFYNDGSGDIEVNHPRQDNPCIHTIYPDGSEDNNCYSIPGNYATLTESVVLTQPEEFGLELGVNLFRWNQVSSQGTLISLKDTGEDILIQDADGNNLDCVDYIGWTPNLSADYDLKFWPLVKAGIFGNVSIEKFVNKYQGNQGYIPNPEDSDEWYAYNQISSEASKGSPGQENTQFSFSTNEALLDLSNYVSETGDLLYQLQFINNSQIQFIFEILGVTFIGNVNDEGKIVGTWNAYVPGYGIGESITGNFETSQLNWDTEAPPQEDDCGVIGGNNDCSLCNEANGYQCDNCECSGCTDPEALNYGVYEYGECVPVCVGSGECNFTINQCSGQHSSYCNSDSDCIFTGYQCTNDDFNLDCSGGSGNVPNPTVFGSCNPNGTDNQCVQLVNDIEPLVDDGSCEYPVLAGYLDARIVDAGDSMWDLQFKVSENNLNNLMVNPHNRKFERVSGDLAKEIKRAKRRNKRMNQRHDRRSHKKVNGIYIQRDMDINDNNRETLMLAGLETSVWSARCVTSDLELSTPIPDITWYNNYNILTSFPGRNFAKITSVYIDIETGNIVPIEVGNDWVSILRFEQRTNANAYTPYLTEDPYCGDVGVSNTPCDQIHLIVSDMYGNQLGVTIDDDSALIPTSNCSFPPLPGPYNPIQPT